MEQTRGSQVPQDMNRLSSRLRTIRGDAYIESATAPDCRVECAHRLFERRLCVVPVRIEDVDVLEPHALEALIQTGEEILARAPLSVWAGPHAVPSLGRDDELIAVVGEVPY